MQLPLFRILCLAGICAASAGCTGPLAIALTGASVASYVTTGKSLGGHAVHALTGRDCDTLNLIMAKPLCPPQVRPVAEADDSEPLYCYRTLGQITCHRDPDPRMSAVSRVQ